MQPTKCGPAVFFWAAAVSELDSLAFFNWVQAIIEPFTGEV